MIGTYARIKNIRIYCWAVAAVSIRTVERQIALIGTIQSPGSTCLCICCCSFLILFNVFYFWIVQQTSDGSCRYTYRKTFDAVTVNMTGFCRTNTLYHFISFFINVVYIITQYNNVSIFNVAGICTSCCYQFSVAGSSQSGCNCVLTVVEWCLFVTCNHKQRK